MMSMVLTKDNEKILLLEEKIEHLKEIKSVTKTILSENLVENEGEKERYEREVHTIDDEISLTNREIERIIRAGKARGDDCGVCRAARYHMCTACNMCPYNYEH